MPNTEKEKTKQVGLDEYTVEINIGERDKSVKNHN